MRFNTRHCWIFDQTILYGVVQSIEPNHEHALWRVGNLDIVDSLKLLNNKLDDHARFDYHKLLRIMHFTNLKL